MKTLGDPKSDTELAQMIAEFDTDRKLFFIGSEAENNCQKM